MFFFLSWALTLLPACYLLLSPPSLRPLYRQSVLTASPPLSFLSLLHFLHAENSDRFKYVCVWLVFEK